MKRQAILVLVLLLVLLTTWLYVTHKTQLTATNHASPSSTPSLRTSINHEPGCSPGYHNVQTPLYVTCIPQTWEASAGDPPDPSEISLGPQDLFRPLITISVFEASDLSKTEDLLLADTVIQERGTQHIADVGAEEVTFRALQGENQKVLFFQKARPPSRSWKWKALKQSTLTKYLKV